MGNIGGVTYNLDANIVKLQRKLTKAAVIADRNARKTQNAYRKAFRNIRRQAGLAGQALVAFVGVQTIRSIVQAGVAMQRIERGFRAATGTIEQGRREFDFVRQESDRLGLSLEGAATQYTKLTAAAKGTALQGAEARRIFTAVSEASRVLGLSAEQTQGALTAIEQIISKGKVSAEELRGQLGERLPGAFQIAARAMGVTTAELDEMLRKGEVTAEQMLPRLADELRNTFGSEVESAANDAQAAFNRFSTAVFELRRAIAESGLLQQMTALAEKARQVAIGVGAIFFDASPEAFGAQLQRAQQHVQELQTSIDFLLHTGETYDSPIVQNLLQELVHAERAVENLRKKSLSAMTDVTEAFDATDTSVKAAGDAVEHDFIRPFNHKMPRLPQAIKTATDEMQEISKQAARNMQDAFADFLFDPFEDGLKGMLKSFLDTIRRMLANKLAVQLFEGLGMADWFGGAKASGGAVTAGRAYLVGEKGPELMVPGASGTIIPNDKLAGGGVNVTYNINAPGADAGVIARMVPLLERTKEATIAEVRQLKTEGRL